MGLVDAIEDIDSIIKRIKKYPTLTKDELEEDLQKEKEIFQFILNNDCKSAKAWLYGMDEYTVSLLSDKAGWNILHDAIALNRTGIVDYMLSNSAFNPNMSCQSQSMGLRNWCPIHVACEFGAVEILGLLLNKLSNDEVYFEVVKSELIEPNTVSSISSTNKEDCPYRQSDTYAILEGWNALHTAVIHNQYQCVLKLLANGVFVDARSTVSRQTPLMLACRVANVDIVQLLLKYGADIWAVNESDKTPLFYASLRGAYDIVNVILDAIPNESDQIDLILRPCGKYRMSSIHASSLSSQLDSYMVMVRFMELIEPTSEYLCCIGYKLTHSQLEIANINTLILAVLTACFTENNSIFDLQMNKIRYMLSSDWSDVNSNCTINGIMNIDSLQLVLFLQFVKHSCIFINSPVRLELIDLFLNYSINVNNLNSNDKTALIYAVEMNMISLVQKLLKCDADPNIGKSNGMTCLMIAIDRQFKELVSELIKVTSSSVLTSVNRTHNSVFGTVTWHDSGAIEMTNYNVTQLAMKRNDVGLLIRLMECCGNQLKDSMVELIRNNELIGQVNLLHLATITSNDTYFHFIEYLINIGLGIESTTIAGDTPLLFAAKFGRIDVCKFLISRGANIEAKNNLHEDALIIGAIRKDKEMLKYFLETGINVNNRDFSGMTALYHCMLNNFRPGIELFLNSSDCMCTVVDTCSFCVSLSIINKLKLNFSLIPPNQPVSSPAENESNNTNEATDTSVSTLIPYLALAIQNGQMSDVDILLKKGVDINEPFRFKGSTITPVFMILESPNNLKILAKLIDHGCDLNKVSLPNKETVLHSALRRDKQDTAVMLIYNGANLESRCQMWQGDQVLPIHVAVQNGQNTIIQLLTIFGCSLNSTMTLRSVDRVSPLHLASLNDLSSTIKLLIGDGTSSNSSSDGDNNLGRPIASVYVNSTRSDSFNALLTMVSKKNVTGVQNILEAGANVNCRCVVSRSRNAACLHMAAQVGNVEIIQCLLEYGADPLARMITGDSDGILPIHLACESGRKEAVQLFMQWGVSVLSVEDRGLSCLHYAASAGDVEIVQMLLEAGADVNARATDGNRTDMLPIHVAAEKGFLKVVKLLIKYGSPINDLFSRVNRSRLSCLYVATSESRDTVVRYLIKCGANCNIQESNLGALPLHIVCQKGYQDPFYCLVGIGSSDINKTLMTGISALHLTAEKGFHDFTFWLLRFGADPNQVGQITDTYSKKTSYMISPLNQACGFGHLEIVNLLIANGADIHWPEIFEDHEGIRPIHCAAIRGRHNVIPGLIKAGADINQFDDKHRTPLHWAVIEGSYNCCRLLLELGADPHICDIENHKPVDYASTSNIRSLFF